VKWKIPCKYQSADFVNFLLNTNSFDRDFRLIRDGFGSLEEWAHYYELPESHGITLEELLHFLADNCCIQIMLEENLIRLNNRNLALLELKIRKRIKK